MNQQAERRLGTILAGKWRVDALLGSGSMAAVYAATHRNGARAALKILHPTLCTDPAVCERFLGEGYLANSVKHPGVVRVLDDGVTDDGCVFLVMDLLEGETLEALRDRRGGRIPLVEALELSDKLMDVLGAVHAAGIIHRDLKPQNVFACDDGTVRLLDFGVARAFDRASASKLSMFGLVLGTPSFMSPEQALGTRDKVDHRSDIWSLGATIFTALAGETVHLGANMQAKLLAAATVKARSISMVMPELPPALAGAIDAALRFKKEDRWQSVDAMRRAFRDARVQLEGQPMPESPLHWKAAEDALQWGAETILTTAPPVHDLPVGTFAAAVSNVAPLPAKRRSGVPPPLPTKPPSSVPPPLPARAPLADVAFPKAGAVETMPVRAARAGRGAGTWIALAMMGAAAAAGAVFFFVSGSNKGASAEEPRPSATTSWTHAETRAATNAPPPDDTTIIEFPETPPPTETAPLPPAGATPAESVTLAAASEGRPAPTPARPPRLQPAPRSPEPSATAEPPKPAAGTNDPFATPD